MSKFLRFIVNLFIVVAILTAAAILIPPLAGVNTTIVDSAAMDTNLPLGSITYSRSVARSGIKAGDEVLRETSGSVYAYVIKEVGENGTYTAVSAVDDSASAQTISLGDPVLRVAVVVPWIGYVVMALQSTEGILILVLIAVLVIVLFILSELWKPERTEDEDEEEEEPAEEKPEEITAPDDGGIDTDVIRQAMNENNDELAKTERTGDTAGFGGLQKEAAEPSGTAAEETLSGVPETGAETTEENAAAAEGGTAQAEGEEPAAPEDKETPERGGGKKSWRERRAEKKAKKKAEKAGKSDGTIAETPYTAESTEEEAPAAAQAVPEEPAPSGEPAAMPESSGAEKNAAETEESPQSGSAADWAPEAAEAPQVEAAAPETSMSDPDRFIPVNRPTLGELLEEARKSGDKPKVEENEATGITTVDYTDVL